MLIIRLFAFIKYDMNSNFFVHPQSSSRSYSWLFLPCLINSNKLWKINIEASRGMSFSNFSSLFSTMIDVLKLLLASLRMTLYLLCILSGLSLEGLHLKMRLTLTSFRYKTWLGLSLPTPQCYWLEKKKWSPMCIIIGKHRT